MAAVDRKIFHVDLLIMEKAVFAIRFNNPSG